MQALKGTHDILPDEVYKWDYMEGVIRDVCARYGYKEIRTPIIEATELFQRGIGDTTDVVTKEMYTFKDRGNRSVTLRPENTASAVRAYLEHKMYGDQQVHKMFYIGSMFRYDRPQAGRYREFHQFGLEVLGASSPLADAEVIAMAFSHRFMDHFTNKQLLLAVLFLSGTEYLINFLSEDFLVLSIATVLTKFFASGTFIMLNLKMVSTLLNRKLIATGTAVVAMLSRNIGTIFFQLMAGPVIDNVGLNYLYLILFVFTVLAAVIALLFTVPAQPKERLFS